MKKFISFIVITIVLFSIGTSSYSQNSIATSALNIDATASSWMQFKEMGSVVIYYRYLECGPDGYVLFRVDNNYELNCRLNLNH